ncbi:MAG: DUF2380 domain-containing protein [Fidelibacterota bacterium]|nr:MAG: DUF2380 domain-containing protein [Candidatus Neomarinimicrobiota bacterium]
MTRPRLIMKSYSSLLLAGGVLFQMTFLPAQNIPIAVMDFDGRGISDIEASALTDRLRNELFRLGAFEVVERGLMENILTEQDFQLTGCTSNECLVEVGRLLGARQIVGGSISKVGGTFTVSARLVDVETGKVLGVSDFDLRGELDDMLTTGMQQVAVMLSGEQAVAERQVQTFEPPRPRRAVVSGRTPWQVLIGIPAGEGGYGAEASKFIGSGWPIGPVHLRPAFSGGLLDRWWEDTEYEEYYYDFRGYLSLTGHGVMERDRIGGSIYLGLGLSVGEYWEEVEGDDWYSDEMELLLSLGAQLRLRFIDTLHLLADTRIVSTSNYGASFMFQVGLQR